MKPEWKRECTRLDIPFDLLHLRERDERTVEVTEGHTPCVLADTDQGLEMLLDDQAIRACEGDPRRLIDAVEQALVSRGWSPG